MSELKKKMEVLKTGNDRVREENAAYEKQNKKLLDKLKEYEMGAEDHFRLDMANSNAIKDPELTPRTLERRYFTVK